MRTRLTCVVATFDPAPLQGAPPWDGVPGVEAPYVFSEVFDLKPTSGLCLKNLAHLSNFLAPRTVSAIIVLVLGWGDRGGFARLEER
jgi:hypothetical protein